jgi:hypothetical protein
MRLKRRYGMVGAALLVAGLVAAGVASAGSKSSSGAKVVQTQTVVDVPADTVDNFVDSHVALTQNEQFSISATGTANWDYDHPAVGPVGLKFQHSPCAANQYADPTSWPSTGINCYSLVGKIGSGPVFLVGTRFKLKSPVAGELYLGFNDDYPYDNSGDFTATVTTP